MNAILDRLTRYHTCTVKLNNVELDVDYSDNDGVLTIERILTVKGDDITGLLELIDRNGSLFDLVERDWEAM